MIGQEPSLTMIAKLGRLCLKFNKVKKSAIKTTVNDYIRSNVVAIENTLGFYPGLHCFQYHLIRGKSARFAKKNIAVERDWNQLIKTPRVVY
jgi:hypothetical protein